MSDLVDQINKLEQKAHALKDAVSKHLFSIFDFYIQRKYVDALKKFDELIVHQKELYGDKSESVMKSSQEAAIICNILSMSFLQKGRYKSLFIY